MEYSFSYYDTKKNVTLHHFYEIGFFIFKKLVKYPYFLSLFIHFSQLTSSPLTLPYNTSNIHSRTNLPLKFTLDIVYKSIVNTYLFQKLIYSV